MYLNLYNNQLSGSIPADLGNLTNLQQLWLYNNQLSGSIPAELGNLTKLYSLALSNNQLSGSIPAELGNLSNLQGLLLSSNALSGIIPKELGNLSNLQTLDLSYNQLSGSIPAELGNLANLVHLYLHSNQFVGEIPSSVASLPNLTQFDFSNNLFIGIPAVTSVNLNVAEGNGLRTANNYLTFASLEPNAANLQYASKYAPQKELSLVISGSAQQAGASLNLDIATLVGRSLGGSNNHYQWYKDGNPVGTDSPILSLANLSSANAGSYKCIITNSVLTGLSLSTSSYVLSVSSSAVSLNILSPTAVTGTTATIPVSVVTSESTNVTLYYRQLGGSNLSTSSQNTSGNTTLNFNLTGLLPNTTYYCYALTQNLISSNEINFTTTSACAGTIVEITSTDFEICKGLTLAYYSVSNTQYSLLEWSATNGQIVSGQGQRIVTVKWDENQNSYAINLQFTDLHNCKQSLTDSIDI